MSRFPPAPAGSTAELPRRGLIRLGLALACPTAVWAGGGPREAPKPGAAADRPLPALIPDDVLLDYQRFLAGRDPLAIVDFGGLHARRDVIEVLLLQQALARQEGGRRLHLA